MTKVIQLANGKTTHHWIMLSLTIQDFVGFLLLSKEKSREGRGREKVTVEGNEKVWLSIQPPNYNS